MNVDITARHIQLDERLRAHASERLASALRHAEAVTSAHVILDRERERAIAEIVVRGRNLAAVVVADGDDHFLAIDRCSDKLRHQLDTHVGRAKERRRKAAALREVEAELAAFAATQAATLGQQPAPASDAAPAASEPAPSPAPALVRQDVASLPSLSLEAAMASLDDSGLEFLVFRDPKAPRVSVLYRRADGDVGLIEVGA